MNTINHPALFLWLGIGSLVIIACLIIILPDILKKNKNYLPGFLIVLILPVISILIYWHDGHGTNWVNYEKLEAIRQKPLPNANKIIEQLETHLAQKPDAQGFYLLGRIYASQQNFQKAAAFFNQANRLKPHDTRIELNYAEALLMLKKPEDIITAQKLLNNILSRETDVGILDATKNLLALSYYQQKNYRAAIKIWEELSERYSPDTKDGKALLDAIARAQAQLAAK